MAGFEEVEDRNIAMEVEDEVLSQHEDGQGGLGWEDEVVEEVGEAKEAEGEKKELGKKESASEVKEWGSYRMETGGWMQQCSKHLSNMEKRMMEGEFLGHEVVRQIGMLLTSFSPPDGGLGVAPEAGFGHRGEDDAAACEVLPEGW